MRKTKKKALSFVLWAVCAMLIALNGLGMAGARKAQAYYCDDGTYRGEGTHVSSTYTVEFDSQVEHNEYRVSAAPSLYGGSLTYNDCAVTAGLNIVTFYDRYYTNLIPDYAPGAVIVGNYRYFSNSNTTLSVHSTLYEYMNTNVTYPGTSEDDFKNGLKRYVNEQGYNIAYSSIHQNAQTVNLTKLRQMINSNRVAAIFFLDYNFVFDFKVTDSSRIVYQEKANASHVMMVYGYFTVDYYKNNQLFLTETYLQVASCNSMGDRGYVKLNDYGTIEDAVMITISQ